MLVGGKELRCGYTTGTCAAAAAKAAVLAAQGHPVDQVEMLLDGKAVCIPIISTRQEENGCFTCMTVKDAGDDPDVTNGLEIGARIHMLDTPTVLIDGGIGVGRVTKKGLKVPVGKAAINPAPLEQIEASVRSALPEGKGAQVEIFVPLGAEIAQKTFNPRLGIVGGISILGTTGVVRPMSEDAYKDSLALELDMLAAAGKSSCAFVFGELGKKMASSLGVKEECCIVTSNFLGYMLDYAVYRKFTGILLVGQLGKLVKVAGGIFHTHSRIADGRMEILTAFAGLCGGERALLEELITCNTTQEAVEILRATSIAQPVYDRLAEASRHRCEQYTRGGIHMETALFSDEGELLAQTAGAIGLAEKLKQGG